MLIASEEQARIFYKKGLLPQTMMIMSFMANSAFFHFAAKNEGLLYKAIHVAGAIGFAIFSYCLLILYINKGKEGLITTGVFKYTRHPMYTGIFITNTEFLLRTQVFTWYFLLFNILFYTGILWAGYMQEKETLARFGQSTKEYYNKTPRLFFMYPLKLAIKNS